LCFHCFDAAGGATGSTSGLYNVCFKTPWNGSCIGGWGTDKLLCGELHLPTSKEGYKAFLDCPMRTLGIRMIENGEPVANPGLTGKWLLQQCV